METAWRAGFSHSLLKGETQRKTVFTQSPFQDVDRGAALWENGDSEGNSVSASEENNEQQAACPKEVMLECFCPKQNHVAWLQRDFALKVRSAGRRIRTHVSKIKQRF